MLGAGLQFNRNRGEDRFYNPAKARRNYHQNNQRNPQLQRTQSDIVSGGGGPKCKEETPKPVALPSFEQVEDLSLSNVERFLQAITPSVQAQYLSKTTLRGWRTCDVEYQPYFMLSDLWESFKEWSAYGAGVPLVLNGSDSVIQYYVPYLSAIQIYVDPSKSSLKSRRASEDSDADYLSRDSSSDGSSDSERDRGLTCSRGQTNHYNQPSDMSLKMDRVFSRDQHTAIQEGFSSDEGESGNPQGCLLFEYLEHDPPYGREPLADKISDLALRFPELKSFRSCDVLSSSWFSVAWYPIYRIPTGPTLKDLDACFLTYHSLYTPLGGSDQRSSDVGGQPILLLANHCSNIPNWKIDVPAAQAPVMIYPDEIDGIPRISLPVFGLASYKFRGSLWTSSGGSDRQLVNSLSQAADNWLRLLQVNHPDYLFFCRNR